mmetsp:Transcript_60715/g.112646  ORF Transcript_60715/g.112646 Transcript_60715/m.112646 type:complete len:97 (-) Transcript_60715:121-411(-)
MPLRRRTLLLAAVILPTRSMAPENSHLAWCSCILLATLVINDWWDAIQEWRRERAMSTMGCPAVQDTDEDEMNDFETRTKPRTRSKAKSKGKSKKR